MKRRWVHQDRRKSTGCPENPGAAGCPVLLLVLKVYWWVMNDRCLDIRYIKRKKWFMIMMANDILGWMGRTFSRYVSYSWGKTPEIPQPGKLTRPRIETWPLGRGNDITSRPQQWCHFVLALCTWSLCSTKKTPWLFVTVHIKTLETISFIILDRWIKSNIQCLMEIIRKACL